MISKAEIAEMNSWMLRNRHYSREDREKMMKVDWNHLAAKQMYSIFRIYMKYPQLQNYKSEFKEAAEYYRPVKALKVIKATDTKVYVLWKVSQHISDQLKGKLDKAQYSWTRIGSDWVLVMNVEYITQFTKLMEGMGVNCSQIHYYA